MRKSYHNNLTALIKLIPITIFFILWGKSVYAENLICVFPINKEIFFQTKHQHIELWEPKTVIKLDKFKKVETISSPNCQRFKSIAEWQQSLSFDCQANDGAAVNIIIDLASLQVSKKLVDLQNNTTELRGFCVRE